MPYREPGEVCKFTPPVSKYESKLKPWYERLFTRPFKTLTVLNSEHCAIMDNWGRVWYENEDVPSEWISESPPFSCSYYDLNNPVRKFRSAISAHRKRLKAEESE